jgi:hypothetical protein
MDNDGTTSVLPAPGRTQRMAYVLVPPHPKKSPILFPRRPYPSDPTLVPSGLLGRGHRVKRLKPGLAALSELEHDSEDQLSILHVKSASSSRKRAPPSGPVRIWCHQCHRSVNTEEAQRCSTCDVGYCEKCLFNRCVIPCHIFLRLVSHVEGRYRARLETKLTWLCPRCAGYCDCGACVRKRGLELETKRLKIKLSISRPRSPLLDDPPEVVPENVNVKYDSRNESPVSLKTDSNDAKLSTTSNIPGLSGPFSSEIACKDALVKPETAQYYLDSCFLIDRNPTDSPDNYCSSSDPTLYSMSPYASPDIPTPSYSPIIVPDAPYYSHDYSQFFSCNSSSPPFPASYDSIFHSRSNLSRVPSLINDGDARPSSPTPHPSYKWGDFDVHGDDVNLSLEEVWPSLTPCSHISPASCTCSSPTASRLDDAETFARFINIDLLEETPSSSLLGVPVEDQ